MSPSITTEQPKRRSLLDIQDDFLALDDLIDEVGGEITDPRVEHALDSLIHEMGVERDRKLDGYCAFIRELELRSAARNEEVERLQLRIKRDVNVIIWLKTRMIEFLRSINTKKVETDRFVMSRCANGGKLRFATPATTATYQPITSPRSSVTASTRTRSARISKRGSRFPVASSMIAGSICGFPDFVLGF